MFLDSGNKKLTIHDGATPIGHQVGSDAESSGSTEADNVVIPILQEETNRVKLGIEFNTAFIYANNSDKRIKLWQ